MNVLMSPLMRTEKTGPLPSYQEPVTEQTARGHRGSLSQRNRASNEGSRRLREVLQYGPEDRN